MADNWSVIEYMLRLRIWGLQCDLEGFDAGGLGQLQVSNVWNRSICKSMRSSDPLIGVAEVTRKTRSENNNR
jgi:hypothetical protein